MDQRLLHRFISDESGAVTVDWVVLTAALASLGLALIMAIDDQIYAEATYISDQATATAAYEFTLGGS